MKASGTFNAIYSFISVAVYLTWIFYSIIIPTIATFVQLDVCAIVVTLCMSIISITVITRCTWGSNIIIREWLLNWLIGTDIIYTYSIDWPHSFIEIHIINYTFQCWNGPHQWNISYLLFYQDVIGFKDSVALVMLFISRRETLISMTCLY